MSEIEEPKWKDSEARKLLYQDVLDGVVPLQAKDAQGRTTMKLKEIFSMHQEYSLFDYDKFSRRVSSIRAIVKKNKERSASDEQAFNTFVQNHDVSYFSNRGGYIQWQGSKAQELLKTDIDNGLLDTLSKQALWGSREEYSTNFPLKVFRDKIYQELRTAKYLHTLKVKGKHYKAS